MTTPSGDPTKVYFLAVNWITLYTTGGGGGINIVGATLVSLSQDGLLTGVQPPLSHLFDATSSLSLFYTFLELDGGLDSRPL